MSWSLLAFVGFNFLAALSGAVFGPGDWFRRLEKPSWQPPDWAFPVVWFVLYLLNAVAGWIIWTEHGDTSAGRFALAVYGGSLVLNAGWSAVFFGLKRVAWATFEAVLLWLSVLAQIILFAQLTSLAGLMLLPYLAWVTVAVALSAKIWQLNGPAPA
ncbi:MAG: TspO/MBR family protein [Pseudomonadota bacterium]